MKFKTKEYLADFYGYEFKPGEVVNVKEPSLIKKFRKNPKFTEVRAKRDSKRTV